jgi:hypothetical protein
MMYFLLCFFYMYQIVRVLQLNVFIVRILTWTNYHMTYTLSSVHIMNLLRSIYDSSKQIFPLTVYAYLLLPSLGNTYAFITKNKDIKMHYRNKSGLKRRKRKKICAKEKKSECKELAKATI